MMAFETPDEYEAWVATLATQATDMGEDPRTIATKSITDVWNVDENTTTLLTAGIGSVVRAYPCDVIRHNDPKAYPARTPETIRGLAVELLAANIEAAQ